MWDILKGEISYFIRDFLPDTNFFVDSAKRGKSFRGIPKHLSDYIPIVCGRKDRTPHGTFAKVTLKFNNNELKPELERLQYREDEKAILAADRQKVSEYLSEKQEFQQQPQQQNQPKKKKKKKVQQHKHPKQVQHNLSEKLLEQLHKSQEQAHQLQQLQQQLQQQLHQQQNLQQQHRRKKQENQEEDLSNFFSNF